MAKDTHEASWCNITDVKGLIYHRGTLSSMEYKVHTLVMRHSLYTAACYYRSHDIDGACVDKDAGLKVLSIVILFLMKQFMNEGSSLWILVGSI